MTQVSITRSLYNKFNFYNLIVVSVYTRQFLSGVWWTKHHLKTSHTIDWDSTMFLTYSTNYYQWIILESWFTNLELSVLFLHLANIIAQQESVTHCLLFILQPIHLHNLSTHMSSQSITSCIYQPLLYLLADQIAHQGFWIVNWLRLSLNGGFLTGCRNVSHKHRSFSGL